MHREIYRFSELCGENGWKQTIFVSRNGNSVKYRSSLLVVPVCGHVAGCSAIFLTYVRQIFELFAFTRYTTCATISVLYLKYILVFKHRPKLFVHNTVNLKMLRHCLFLMMLHMQEICVNFKPTEVTGVQRGYDLIYGMAWLYRSWQTLRLPQVVDFTPEIWCIHGHCDKKRLKKYDTVWHSAMAYRYRLSHLPSLS